MTTRYIVYDTQWLGNDEIIPADVRIQFKNAQYTKTSIQRRGGVGGGGGGGRIGGWKYLEVCMPFDLFIYVLPWSS